MTPNKKPGPQATTQPSPSAAAEAPDWNALSPVALWREWIARSEAQWSEAVSQLLKDPRAGGALHGFELHASSQGPCGAVQAGLYPTFGGRPR